MRNLIKNITDIYKTHIILKVIFTISIMLCFVPLLLIVIIIYNSKSLNDNDKLAIAFLMIVTYFLKNIFLYSIKIVTQQIKFNNTNLVISYGIVNKKTIEIVINNIESISIAQGFFSRLFNFGNITIKGFSGTNHKIYFINYPNQLNHNIKKIRNQ